MQSDRCPHRSREGRPGENPSWAAHFQLVALFTGGTVRKHEVWSLETVAQVLVLLMMNCVTLGKTSNFSEMSIRH